MARPGDPVAVRPPDEEVDALIRRNLRSAIEAGTTALGDITTAGRSWDAVAAAPVRATVFAEVLGLSAARGCSRPGRPRLRLVVRVALDGDRSWAQPERVGPA